jgi:glycyl-tRNA synthetase beta chain
VLQLQAGRVTHGHRFQGAQNITLAHAEEYESKLRKEGGVIARFEERREEIIRQLVEQASLLSADLRLDERTELLDEVAALVEFPTVYIGEFEQEFLAVPQECLILTMQQNQKYFPLFGRDGRLLNRFLIVSNMRLEDPANIVEGNQRVVRPRLADARFFFETDRKTRLAERVPRLAGIVYHNKLGSQLERVERLRGLARTIAERMGTDAALADRAALLCKADLLTGMVGEFPELQGIMGRYYALHDGEDQRVADAIEAHYRPRFSADTLAPGGVATALALADKLDALVGMFGIVLAPTGEKDPFGLRRQAMGVVRTLAEQGLPLDLVELLDAARDLFPSQLLMSSVVNDVHLFILDRLRSYLRERAFQPDEIEAVLSQVPSRIDLVLPRLKAVQGFKKLPEAEALASANKRIQNILRKSELAGDSIQPKLFREAEEIDLYDLMVELDGRVEPLVESGNYDEALKALASLRRPVDTFFDRVLVNADDMRIRANRHGLLLHLSALMNQVADISKLVRSEA